MGNSFEKISPIKGYDTDIQAFNMKNGEYMDILTINTHDVTAGSADENYMNIYSFMKFYRTYGADIKIVAMNLPVSTIDQQHYLEHKINSCENPIYRRELEIELSTQKKIEEQLLELTFCLFVYADTAEKMISNRNRIINNFKYDATIGKIQMEQKLRIVFRLHNKNMLQKQMNKHLDFSGISSDKQMIQQLAPIGNIDFKKDERCILTGDGYEAYLYVYGYPEKLENNWLYSVMCSQPNTISILDIATDDMVQVKKNINLSMSEQESRYNTEKDGTARRDAQARYRELEELYEEIQNSGEVVKLICLRLAVFSDSYAELEDSIKSIKDELDSYGITIYINEQLHDWTSTFYSYREQQNSLYKKVGNPVTTETLAAGNPFHFSSLVDPQGDYMGLTDSTSGLMNFDQFYKDEKRLSYNMVMFGRMGAGKSSLLKKLFKMRAIRGDFIRGYDVSGEWRNLVYQYGGKIIALDGSEGTLNPLQILRTAESEELSYTQHIGKCRTLYKFLKPSATDAELLDFEVVLGELYVSCHIIDEHGQPAQGTITGLPAEEYPIFSDLLDYIDRKFEKSEKDFEKGTDLNKFRIKETLKPLIMIRKTVENIVKNYSNIFNKKTDFEDILDIQIVFFDIRGLSKMSANIFDAQMFNTLSLCYDNLVKIGTVMKEQYELHEKDSSSGLKWEDITRFLILIDESHRIINTSKVTAIDLISTYMREARKFFGGICFASQEISDFIKKGCTNDELEKIESLFNLCQYKIIMQQDSNALDVLKKAFGKEVPDNELQKVPTFSPGQCILCISGASNYRFKVDLSESEIQLFSGGA